MAFTTADLDAVNVAIAKGESKVRFADREVIYRTMDELLKARDIILSDLAATGLTTRAARHSRAKFSRS
jgi:hypothetical protein